MPLVCYYKCEKCLFKIWGNKDGGMYVIDDYGKRIICGHPGENETIEEVLGKDPGKIVRNRRVGVQDKTLCLDCLEDFLLDFKRDEHKCPKCKSKNILQIYLLDDKICPKCKEGMIRRINTGGIT